jgi:hypothetical protein
VLRDANEVEKLAKAARSAVQTLLNRQMQLDELFLQEGYRALEGEPAHSTLKPISDDLRDWCDLQTADVTRLRAQLDGRRQPLLGDAQVKLSIAVHAATGQYHDSDVTLVLGELLTAAGAPERGDQWLKRKRARWLMSLSGRSS